MGDLIHLPVTENEDGFGPFSASRRLGADSPSLRVDLNGEGNVIPFDPKGRDLRLLRYRARKLEEQLFELYKGSTTLELPENSGNSQVIIRVFVKSRVVEYLYSCLESGKRVRRSIDCRARCGMDCIELSWPEVQELVHIDVLARMRGRDRQPAKSTDAPAPASNYRYSDKRLCPVPTAEGGSNNDSEEDTLLHRLLRKLGRGWRLRC